MKKVFVDTNVLPDLLLEREPWAQNESVLFSMAERKVVELLCCSLSATIVTRNTSDFAAARLPVLTPQEYINQQ
jgi:predicted nucleic acid-binding protein